MNILCDTSVIMMLIPIAPSMFIDGKFKCCTIQCIRQEIIQTQKFKDKYPWRNKYKAKIKCLPSNIAGNKNVNLYYEVITVKIENVLINKKNGKPFDLSYRDKQLLACAIANGFKISAGDSDIIDYARQEFQGEFKGSVSPLGLVNRWIRLNYIAYDKNIYNLISEWKVNNEHPQPLPQKKMFKKLTGDHYPGS